MIVTAYHDNYTKDEKGNMVLVSSTPYDMEVLPNYGQLKTALYNSDLFKSISEGTVAIDQFGYSTFLKILTDGESGKTDEQTMLKGFYMLKINFTEDQKAQLNKFLEDSFFEIRI